MGAPITKSGNFSPFFHAVFLKDQNNEILTQKVAIFFIKLCNFAASQTDLTEEMLNWLNVLKNMPDMDESDYDKQPAFFQDLLDECRISKLTAMEKAEKKPSSILPRNYWSWASPLQTS